MTRLKHSFKHSLTAITLTAVLAACGGGGSGDEPATGGGSSGGTGSGTSGGTGGGTPGATRPSDFGSTQECMVGRWVLIADQAQRALPAASLPAEVTIDVTGQAIVDIRADGTYTYTPNFTLNFNFDGERAMGTTTGSATGTWSVSSDVQTTTETSSNVTSIVSGAFGTFVVPPLGGFSAYPSRILSCQPMTLTYEVQGVGDLPTFTQTLVLE